MHRSQPPGPGFDFTAHIRRLCQDMTSRLVELRHVDMSRVAVTFVQARKSVPHGTYATLTPLRFAGGRSQVVRRGRLYGMQRVCDESGREMSYLLSFVLPRFLNLAPVAKLGTVVHELWHISPRFDGDLRRFRGRCYAHSASQQQYDAHAARLAARWLALDPPRDLYEFLQADFRGLVAQYGRVIGRRIPAPKIIPL